MQDRYAAFAMTAMLVSCAIALLVALSPLRAQHIDTVLTQEPGYLFMVVERNKKGQVKGPIKYFDAHRVHRRTLEFRDGKLHGTSVYYYPNGGKWAEIPHRNGELHGVVRSYHENGAVEAVKPYKRGKLDGERVLRDPTGALVTGEYVEHLPYDSVRVFQTCVNGRPHGSVVVMSRDTTRLEGQCVNGLAEGVFTVYNRDGIAIRRDTYRKGKFLRSETVL